MSIELAEARRKLDVFEKCIKEPSLILTEEFSQEVSGSNFLRHVKFEDKDIMVYLVDHLYTLNAFKGSILKFSGYTLYVYQPALKYGEFKEFQADDLVFKVTLDDRRFKACKKSIDSYIDIMQAEYELEVVKLDAFWKQFEDLTWKKRVNNAFNSLKSSKKWYVKITDFIFHLCFNIKRIAEGLEREKGRVKSANEYNEYEYHRKCDLQAYYQLNAPMHLYGIYAKQSALTSYFSECGFTNDDTLSDY